MRSLGYESDLRHLQRDTIEKPVTNILNHLGSLNAVCREFNICGSISFKDHPQPMSERSEEVQSRISPSTPPVPRTNQVCVYIDADDHRNLAFVIEDKPPHKLTLAHLRMGLRSMDLRKDVIDRYTVPTPGDEVAHLQYYSDQLVATVITQIYSYMINGGVRYGYITTGQAFVFLHIPADDQTVVQYHLAEPEADVKAHKDKYPKGDYSHHTALGQVLAFTLLAIGSKRTTNAWRDEVLGQLTPWKVDYEALLSKMPESAQKASSASEYIPSPCVVASPDVVDRRRSSLNLRKSCRPQQAVMPDEEGNGSGSGNDYAPEMPTRPPVGGPSRQRPPQAGGAGSSSSHPQGHRRHQDFCTHACLRGLVQSGPLDLSCPNVISHRGCDNCHPINIHTFLALLRDQFARTLDADCEELGLQGARGALFRVTLASHRYTLVAKGTVEVFVPDLRHEVVVYQHLDPLQGTRVPVCLGSIDLIVPYYYDAGITITHMMLLSWAGRRIDDVRAGSADVMDDHGWENEVANAFRLIKDARVQHNDER